MRKPIKLPNFKNEDDERDFWANINLADNLNKDDFQPVSFPNLKPTSRSISDLEEAKRAEDSGNLINANDAKKRGKLFANLGELWKDRKDMDDSISWVKKQRQQRKN